MIPVNIITGFLGAGKTTLLREVLSNPDFSDSAVIVNEFGEIGIDHLLLEEVEEGVLLLDNGCVCCTIRSDLQETLRDLYDRSASGEIPGFRRVFVETTGLADPAPILSTVLAEPVIRNHFRTGNVICAVDGLAGKSTISAHEEARKQIAVADRILITKADLATRPDLAELSRWICQMNPFAEIDQSCGSGFRGDWLFAADVAEDSSRYAEVQRWKNKASAMMSGGHGHHTAGSKLTSFVIEFDASTNWTLFAIWLTALLHRHGDRVLRVKGVLNIQESQTPVVVHGVQHVVHPPMHLEAPDGDYPTNLLVFITNGIEEAQIRWSLACFMALKGTQIEYTMAG